MGSAWSRSGRFFACLQKPSKRHCCILHIFDATQGQWQPQLRLHGSIQWWTVGSGGFVFSHDETQLAAHVYHDATLICNVQQPSIQAMVQHPGRSLIQLRWFPHSNDLLFRDPKTDTMAIAALGSLGSDTPQGEQHLEWVADAVEQGRDRPAWAHPGWDWYMQHLAISPCGAILVLYMWSSPASYHFVVYNRDLRRQSSQTIAATEKACDAMSTELIVSQYALAVTSSKWATLVYELQAPASVCRLLHAAPGLSNACFSPDGRFLAGVHGVGADPHEVQVLDCSSGACVLCIQPADLWPGVNVPAGMTLEPDEIGWCGERQLHVTIASWGGSTTFFCPARLHSRISF